MKRVVGHTKEDVKTLPAWARKRIESLTESVEHWKKTAQSATTPGASNVFVVDDDHEEHGLPEGSYVRFRLNGTSIEVGHDRHGYVDTLEVRSLDGALSIHPQVSNVIHARVTRR